MRGFEDWTVTDVIKHNELIKAAKPVWELAEKNIKKPKYNNKHVTVDSISFDSQKEADYYCELKLRLAAKEIKGFCRQAEFVLAPNLRYKADFIIFNNDGTAEVIDVKGMQTDVYKVKKKVFEDKFNLKIKEV